MLPTIYKVKNIGKGLLSVMAKPVPGEWVEEEFSGLKELGTTLVVSLFETFEHAEIGLKDEEILCLKNNIKFTSFPIKDGGLPDSQKAEYFAKELHQKIRAGEHVVIHCRAGIGRTGIIAGAILLQEGLTAVSAFELISSARGVEVPDSDEQRQWLTSL